MGPGRRLGWRREVGHREIGSRDVWEFGSLDGRAHLHHDGEDRVSVHEPSVEKSETGLVRFRVSQRDRGKRRKVKALGSLRA